MIQSRYARVFYRIGILGLAAVPACGPGSPSVVPDAPHAAAPGEAPSNRIEIPATVRRNLGITFAEVEVRSVARTIRVPGVFELEPLARQEYQMVLPGRVELLVDQYEQVQAGDALYRYRSPAWPELLHEIILGEQAIATAQAEIKVGAAKLAEARRKLEWVRGRIAALEQADFKRADLEAQAAEVEAGLPRLEAELDLSETHLANARRTRQHALHRAATASGISEAELELEVPVREGAPERVPRYLTLDWIEVSALQPGVVEALAVTDGAFLEPPAQVLSTVDPSRLRFRAHALQADLARISDASEARIVPTPSPEIANEAFLAARLTVGLEAHPEERTIALIATPTDPMDGANAIWARAGVSAFLELAVEATEERALAVPRSAVVKDGLTHVVFRRDPKDPNQAIRVEADMGVSDGFWVELKSGLMRGDEVVLSGAYELKLAMQENASLRASGHFHADGSFHDEH